MPCLQLRPIGFIVLCESIRNGRICRSPVQQLHASVNHRMVHRVRPAAKIFTDFTSIDFGTAKSSRRCTAQYGIDGLCTLLYAGFAYQPSVQRQILHAAVKYSTVRTSKSSFLGWKQKQPYRVYGNFEVHSSLLIRRRIDHLNAHNPPHPLTADMDIVGGLYIVKPLILCKLGADAVGRHGLLCVIVVPSCIGFIDLRCLPESGYIPQIAETRSHCCCCA